MTDLDTPRVVEPLWDFDAPPRPRSLSLDDAAAVDEGRRSSSVTSLYAALLSSLSTEDQRWVLDVVARHRQAEREAEERGETIPGPAW